MSLKIVNNADTARIEMFGPVGQDFWTEGWTLERFRNEVKAINATNVVLELKSFGGDMFEAYAIYDEIKSMKARVTAEIVGACASAITIIASAADKIKINDNQRYLVHQAGLDPVQLLGTRITKEKADEFSRDLESYDNQIITTYIKRTGKSAEALMGLMKQEKWMSAEEALQWGFVDEIIKDKPKITNKMAENTKPVAVTDEDYDKLKEENASLVAKITAMEEELNGLKAKAEEKLDEEIDETVDAAIAEEKFDKEAKATLTAIGKTSGIEALKATIKAVKAPTASVLAGVVKGKDPNAPIDVKAMTFDQKFEAYKQDKITMKQMEE